MIKPLFTSAAHRDLTDILNYIGHDSPASALAWVEKLEAKSLLIAKNPSIGQLQLHLGEGVRVSSLGRYMIFHREVNDRVEILRIIPGGRDVQQL